MAFDAEKNSKCESVTTDSHFFCGKAADFLTHKHLGKYE